jgi:hypothetical protein
VRDSFRSGTRPSRFCRNANNDTKDRPSIVESLAQGGWWFTGESRGILVSGAPGAASPSGVLRTRTPTTITWKTSSEN